MTISEMTEVVKSALDEYRKAKATNNKTIIERAVNEMENVYIMVCCYPVPGSFLNTPLCSFKSDTKSLV
jgi:hypothetical protein